MSKDYIPKNEGQLNIWLSNYRSKLSTHGETLGFTPDQIAALEDACDTLIAKINDVESAKAALKTTVETKNLTKSDTLGLIRNETAKMKVNDNYTEAIGQDMGIIGESSSPDLNTMSPEISAEAFPGYVRIKFTKRGFSGVHIYTRLKGSQTWAFLSRDTNSPYDDHRPLSSPGTPETREYMAIGLDGDDEIGQQSDIVSVVFGG